MKMINIPLLIFTVVVHLSSASDELNDLKLVHVFVRHGARYPTAKETYPNDPHKFEEHQHGQLNKAGKLSSYKLGKFLRDRYGKFLGDSYEHGVIDVESTDKPRTKMTALSLLAGLFPPSHSDKWNDDFPHWQPIPYNYSKKGDDTWFVEASHFCPAYEKNLKKLENSEDIERSLAIHKETFKYIKHHSGKNINDLQKSFKLYQGLSAEQSLNLTLPTWTQRVFPDFLLNITIQRANLHNSDGIMKRLRGGRILTKVLRQIYHKIHKKLHPSNRKMFLYSLHEHNLVAILASMNLFERDFPKYSSAIMIELHSKAQNNENLIKVLYLRDLKEEPQVKAVGNCAALCPVHKFVDILWPNLPINYTEECKSNKNLEKKGIVLPLDLMNRTRNG